MNKKLLVLLFAVITLTFTISPLSTRKTAAFVQDAKAFVGTWGGVPLKDKDGKDVEHGLLDA